MLLARCFCLFALAVSITTAPVIAEPINTDRFGLYVVVDDMDRASAFYEQLFGVPEIRMPSLVGFDVAGGLYGVVSRETYAVNAVSGDTMRAYIKVGDVEETFDKVSGVAPNRLENTAVLVEGSFGFSRVKDPDNDILEFFSIDPAPSQ